MGKWTEAADRLQKMVDEGRSVEEIEETAGQELNKLLEEDD